MKSIIGGDVAQILDELHKNAEAADRAHVGAMIAAIEASGATLEQVVAEKIAEERANYRATYSRYADNFLAVSPRMVASFTRWR